MKYQLIACDLDETLLNDEHQVGQRNKTAILKAKALGIKFVPCTGRLFTSIENVLKELELYDEKDEYVLSANGGILTENQHHHVIQCQGLSFEKTKELFDFGCDKDICITIYTLQHIYVYHLNDNEKERMEHQGIDYLYLQDETLSCLKDEDIVKVLYESLDMSYLKALEPQMQHIVQNEVCVSYSSGRYMELNKLGVDKGQGLKNLAAFLNIPMDAVIAVGDNENDLSMLKIAGLSVAAGNAVESVKQVCDYVTQADCHEGVVAELIEKFIF